ncbi:adenylyltransferase/cytidyltransferase family protein [Glutamicibacter sp. NPDC087344]|uniref:adenylyltransferase/cytidyltransferase family protein n=1 Tax=Glutamicibacter sp. NPDC087344 TaxID=3363994 RepID=UPI00380FA749
MRVGYAAGAYDLFHIGHLNILRQAKQHCDYLIAGVVSDAMCEQVKGIKPFIPEEERLSIVQSLRFVDEAILETLPDKLDTWRDLRFTVFFKGDDWRGTPKGLDLEQRFHEHGVDVEYLPYTLHTSSTKLRLALENFESIAKANR